MTNERKLLEQADEALLTTQEAIALMNHPAAIDALIGYHDACDAGIDAFWDIETDGPRPLYHAHRRKVLYERGRSIMAEDLDIWPDDLRQAFGFPPLPTEGGMRKDSTTPPKEESTDNRKALAEAVHDALAEALGYGAYDCTRVWEAWSVGTMSQDDFVPVTERLDEITAAVLASLPKPAAAVPTPDGHEFTDTGRAALLWVLWHHQDGSSHVGQPIRFALGMGEHDRLSASQVEEARRWGDLKGQKPGAVPSEPRTLRDGRPMPTSDAGWLHLLDMERQEWYMRGKEHSDQAQASQAAEPATRNTSLAAQAPLMTDEEIERAFIKAGGRWNGDTWLIEDADLHPFVRSLAAELPSVTEEMVAAIDKAVGGKATKKGPTA